MKVQEEGNAEEVLFTTFDRFCTNNEKKLTKAINEGEEAIDLLTSKRDSLTA